jgi:ribosomal RNA-processing protein 12
VIKTLSTKSLADTTLLRPHLDYLLKTIFAGMTNDNREHFRTKIKIILERLMAKFGYEAMEPLVPRKHRKLLVNIRKALGRLDKKKKAKQEEYQKRHKEQREDDTMIEREAPEREDDEEDIAKKMLKGETATPVKRVNHYETKLQEALERRRRYKEVQASAAAERGAAPREKSTWILEGTNTRAALVEDEDEEMTDDGRVIDFLDPNANQYIVCKYRVTATCCY